MQRGIQEVLAALEEAEVRYLVVGGVAVVLHGHLRTTLDLDLVVHLEKENVSRALRALAGLGLEPRVPVPLEMFASPQARESWIHEKGMTVFSLWHPEDPRLVVDLFVEEPFDFEEIYQRALVVSLPRARATVISLADLVQMKRAVARPKDKEDVEALLLVQAQMDPRSGEK